MPTSAPPEVLDRLASEMAAFVRALQDELCAALERADGAARFREDVWERPGGGGGRSRVLADGAVLEKAGVNVSLVHGGLSPELAARLPGEGPEFVATGLSVVIHPLSPMVPTAHMNVRFLRRGGVGWFGGGADLTPYYLFEEDAAHFHGVLRDACERAAPGSYARHKAHADRYFHLPHRGEHRGVGGVFFEDPGGGLEAEQALCRELARAFLPAYLPVVERRRALPHGEAERRWQEIRRGRYVEFNLVDDRGTLFGLQTGGRTESILMSLPPRVRFVYGHAPDPGSREAALLEVLRTPRAWV
jgi:coproporphyrinogen III oxidase